MLKRHVKFPQFASSVYNSCLAIWASTLCQLRYALLPSLYVFLALESSYMVNTMSRKSLETLKCLWCAIWVANSKVEKVFDLCLTALKGQYGAIKKA